MMMKMKIIMMTNLMMKMVMKKNKKVNINNKSKTMLINNHLIKTLQIIICHNKINKKKLQISQNLTLAVTVTKTDQTISNKITLIAKSLLVK